MIFESKMDIFEKAVNTGGKIASKNTTLPHYPFSHLLYFPFQKKVVN